ncbi:hypothetical protein [Histidinibacterium lentulum]|uniref:Uncharacterized protein n=1 Tax=Histidinibacterium lentulum TaxID=2480588 RepID=A0A3N2R139_9RHOB|nr:hypothetical protein [Histidinibacterium lentulum]ROU01190.1 hypothetical protein EAT49_11775 [Histidinibacterium lentulum]
MRPEPAAVIALLLAAPAALAETERRTCETPNFGSYPCQLTYSDPAPGYLRSVVVSDPSGQRPSFSMHSKEDLTAQVHVAYPGEEWRYMGTWEPGERAGSVDFECARPAARQPAEVRTRLGADSWQLCVR